MKTPFGCYCGWWRCFEKLDFECKHFHLYVFLYVRRSDCLSTFSYHLFCSSAKILYRKYRTSCWDPLLNIPSAFSKCKRNIINQIEHAQALRVSLAQYPWKRWYFHFSTSSEWTKKSPVCTGAGDVFNFNPCWKQHDMKLLVMTTVSASSRAE